MASLDNVQREKNRGWLSLVPSISLIVLMSGIWIYVVRGIAAHGSFNSANSSLLGQIFAAFVMVIVSGILGIVNAFVQINTGRRNAILTFAMIVSLFAAIVTATIAGSGFHS